MLEIIIPGPPIAQGRARSAPLMRNGAPVLGKGGRPVVLNYDPKESKNWKATAQHIMGQRVIAAYQAGMDPTTFPLQGAVQVSIYAVFPFPASKAKKTKPVPRQRHTKRPDADNTGKACLDSAKGVLWLDDSQVCDIAIRKRVAGQGEAPFVRLRVKPLSIELKEGEE